MDDAGPGLLLVGSGSRPIATPAGNEPQQVFAGEARKIAVIWHNPGEKAIEASLRTRLFQTSSATAVRLSESRGETSGVAGTNRHGVCRA